MALPEVIGTLGFRQGNSGTSNISIYGHSSAVTTVVCVYQSVISNTGNSYNKLLVPNDYTEIYQSTQSNSLYGVFRVFITHKPFGEYGTSWNSRNNNGTSGNNEGLQAIVISFDKKVSLNKAAHLYTNSVSSQRLYTPSLTNTIKGNTIALGIVITARNEDLVSGPPAQYTHSYISQLMGSSWLSDTALLSTRIDPGNNNYINLSSDSYMFGSVLAGNSNINHLGFVANFIDANVPDLKTKKSGVVVPNKELLVKTPERSVRVVRAAVKNQGTITPIRNK